MFGLSEAHALLCPASVMATLSITDILLGKCLIFGLLLGDRGHLWMSKRSQTTSESRQWGAWESHAGKHSKLLEGRTDKKKYEKQISRSDRLGKRGG